MVPDTQFQWNRSFCYLERSAKNSESDEGVFIKTIESGEEDEIIMSG